MKSKFILFVLLILFLTGCSDNDKLSVRKRDDFNRTSEQTKKNLNWMGHWLTEYGREDLLRDIAQDFEFLNPDIDINLKYPQQIMGVRSPEETGKFIADMIKTGNIEWDVVWLDHSIYQHVADKLDDPQWGKKHLVDFEKVPGFKATQKLFILDDPQYREQTGGIIVGPYIEGYYLAITYNKDVSKKLGIEIKQYGMTFEDLLEYVKEVEEYNHRNNTSIAAFYESNDFITTELLFQNLLKSELGNFSDAKEETGSERKNAALLKTFQAFEELGKYNPLIESHKNNTFFRTRHLVLDDECLFFVNGIWMYSHWMGIDEEKTKKMIPAELPVFQKVDYYPGSFIPTWAVMKDSPNRDEAIKLLMFWSRPQVAEKWVRYAKAPTGLAGHMSTSDTGNDPFEQFQAQITEKYGGNIHYSANAGYILGEKNRLLQQNINKQLIELLDGNVSAQQAYNEIMKEVQ